MKILLIMLMVFGCGSPKTEGQVESQEVGEMPNLEQTKWLFKVIEGVYNYYEFTSKSDFKYYSAEQEDMFYGNYEIKNDTLYTYVKVSASDSLLDESSPHRSLKRRSKFIMNDEGLLMVHNEYKHNTGWKTTKPPSEVIYIKEN